MDKICAKGISRSTSQKINRKQFIDALYDLRKQDYGMSNIFLFDRTTTTMNTVNQQKKLLNNFYTKFTVEDDLVTLTPLREFDNLI